jgi:hypothetical protein
MPPVIGSYRDSMIIIVPAEVRMTMEPVDMELPGRAVAVQASGLPAELEIALDRASIRKRRPMLHALMPRSASALR